MYTVKEVSEILNLSEHTIRYYTDQGIVEVKRDQNNRRLFDEQAIDWLRGARYLKGLGMSIEDIKQFHALCKQDGDEAIQARLDILLKQQTQVLEELEHAKKRVEYLNHKIEKERKVLQHLIPDSQNPNKKNYSNNE